MIAHDTISQHRLLIRALAAGALVFALLFLTAGQALSVSFEQEPVVFASVFHSGADSCLALLRADRSPPDDPAAILSDGNRRATAGVVAVSLAFGLHTASGPLEQAGSTALAIAGYRECRKQQALQDRVIM